MQVWLNRSLPRLVSISLVLSDIMSLLFSLGLAYFLRFKTDWFEPIPRRLNQLEPRAFLPGEAGGPLAAETVYLITAAALIVIWLFLFKYYRLYKEKRSSSRIDNWMTISTCITLGTLTFLVATFFIRSFTFSRVVIVMFWIFNIITTILGRVIIRQLQARLRRSGYDQRAVILVGRSHIGDILHRDITSLPRLGFTFLGWVDNGHSVEQQSLGSIEDIPAIVRKHGPLDVFIVDPHLDRNIIMGMIADCDGLPARFKVVSGLFDIFTMKHMETISGFPILEFGDGDFSLWKKNLKRLFDVSVALLSFIMLWPLFIIIPLLIRFTAGGPVIFRQKRIGLNGEPFTIYKFCSMYPHANPYALAPNSINDDRITPIGRFIRRTSLDELPQLLNVLDGTMSIVGPRPEMPFLVERQNKWQRKRMSVKPGMTGVWQTMGRSDLPLQDHLEFDLFYIRNQSLFYDIQIIFRTILVVVFGKGAY